MTKGAFYRGHALYVVGMYVLIGFFCVLIAASFILPVYVFVEHGIDALLRDIVPFLAYLFVINGTFLGFIIAIQVKHGGQRKRICKKFESLSDDEKAKVNFELDTAFAHVRWGDDRLYIKTDGIVDFIDYKNIAWVYRCNNVIPMVAPAEDVTTISHHNFLRLHVYDTDGLRYKIMATGLYEEYSADEIIERLKLVTPDIIVGFSKARLKRAKKDFSAFVNEEREAQIEAEERPSVETA